MRTISSGWLALSMLAIACGGDDAETATDDTAADDDDGSSSATNPTTTTVGEDTLTTTAADDDSSDGTTAADTTTSSDTTAADSSDGTTTDDGGSSDSTDGDSSTGNAACTPIEPDVLDDLPLNGDGFCEGVQSNVVITDQAGLEAHFAEYCETAAMCMFPEPPCPPVPEIDFTTQRIAYVFGTGSGCSGFADVTDVSDCGDTVEVHYLAGGVGPCDAIVNGWEAVLIPLGGDVEFIQD